MCKNKTKTQPKEEEQMDRFVIMVITDEHCDYQIGFDQKNGVKYCDRKAKYINTDLLAPKGKRGRCINHRPPSEQIVL